MKKRSPKRRPVIQEIVSIPPDVVLSPQSEAPRLFRGEDTSGTKSPLKELTWAEFDRMVQALAREVARRFAPEAVVGVAHGGVFVGGAVAAALGCDFFPVRISRRSRDKVVRRAPRMFGQMPRELSGKRVLVVDDVAASGDTLELATTLALKVGASEVRTATLVSRSDGFAPAYVAQVTDALVVFPWDYEPVSQDSRFDVDPGKLGV